MSRAVEQIKDKLGIVEVVGNYLKLEKAGANFRARCPFHQEKTPSFFVSPARGSYHCFGCNRGGDIFSFVQEIEGVDFAGALKIMAERAGVSLEGMAVERDQAKQPLYEALDLARRYYAAVLKREPEALEYLASRGVKAETIEHFAIGFAPGAWHHLHSALKSRGCTDKALEDSGLVLPSTKAGLIGTYYDRFRSRIMFPLADASGRTVGFSGRIFGKAADDPKNAKYVNSPQTAVYDKGRLLFGYDKAKVEIRRQDAAILVEGQFDLIMSHQAGFTNTVAVSGTALTREHLEHLGRLTRNLIMAFDGDAAGVAASSRAINLALELGLEVKVAELPAGMDPAELIQSDEAEWRKRVEGAKHVIDFLLGAIERRGLEKRELAHALKREVYPYVAKLRERIDRAHFTSKIADSTGLSEQVIAADIDDLASGQKPNSVTPAAGESVSRERLILERLLGLHWWQKTPVPELAAGRQSEFREREGELVLQAELTYADLPADQIAKEASTLLGELEQELLRVELSEAMAGLAQAERQRDEVAAGEFLKKCQDISRKINDLKGNN